MQKSSRLLCLVDGNLLAHKAYHVLTLALEDNTPVGLIFGFLKQIITLNQKYTPDQIIIVWDGGSARRKAMFSSYKANRVQKQNGFHQQLLILEQILFDLGVDQVLTPGEEADDLICTICKEQPKTTTVLIASNDHDLFQLVCDNVMVVGEKVFNTALVEEKYGVSPTALVDLFALKGDATDNIPGIGGIGQKKALELIKKYGSVEKLLEQITSESKTLQGKEEVIKLNKSLMVLNSDIAYSIKVGIPNLELVRGLFKDYFKFNYFIEHWYLIEALTKKQLTLF